MPRRPVAAGLVAPLVASLMALTGCATAVSGASTAASTPLGSSPLGGVSRSTSSMSPASAAPSPLDTALDAVWAKTPSSSCLMVADGAKVLYERNPDGGVLPASVMKLLTATAVLARIDPTTRLSTPVMALARPDASGTVDGDLWLVGGGDPVLATAPYGAHFARQPRLTNDIAALADRVVAAGVRHVTGRIVGDETRYDATRYLPSWPARYDDETGPLSALSVDGGFQQWDPQLVPFADPAAGAAGVLNALLIQRGVRVDGVPASGPRPTGALELASLPSPTVGELVDHMLLESDNRTAELLLRELGVRVAGQGTTAAGRQVLLDTLTGMGLPIAGVRVLDGSGLDRGNRITCRLLVAVLTSVSERHEITRALPVAAQTGTLYKRFLATPVAGHLRAKTGSISLVASLVGSADRPDGRQVSFAYVQNGVGPRQGRTLQDELGRALVLTPR